MATPQPKPRTFHPAAVAILFIGIAVFIVGLIRVNLSRPALNILPSAANSAREPGPMRIVVTLPPLLWPVKALAPPDAEITLLTPPGSGCEGIELTPTQVAAIARADLIVRSGFGLDDSITNIEGSRSGRREVVLADSIRAEPVGHASRRVAAETSLPDSADAHAWLDPVAMENLCAAALAALSEVFDTTCEPNEWNSNRTRDCALESLLFNAACVKAAETLTHQCRRIDAEYRERLAPFAGRAIVTHHDAFGHLAHRYNLEVAAVIQHAHDAEPSPADLAGAARIIKKTGIKAIFIEPQLNPAAAQRIAEITGVKVFTLDPLGNGDWPAMMRKNLDALVEGLSEN